MEVDGVICRFDAEVSMPANSAHEVYRVRRRSFDTDVLQSFLQSLPAAPEAAYETAETVEQVQAQIEGRAARRTVGSRREWQYRVSPICGRRGADRRTASGRCCRQSRSRCFPLRRSLSPQTLFVTPMYCPMASIGRVRMSENGFFALTYGDARLQPESDVQLGFARFEEPPGDQPSGLYRSMRKPPQRGRKPHWRRLAQSILAWRA